MKCISVLYVPNIFYKVFGITRKLVHTNYVLLIDWLVIVWTVWDKEIILLLGYTMRYLILIMLIY